MNARTGNCASFFSVLELKVEGQQHWGENEMSKVTATNAMVWRSGKKELIKITSVEERAIVVPTRATPDELDALATACREAAKVLRDAAKEKPTKRDAALHGSVHGSPANGDIAGETGKA